MDKLCAFKSRIVVPISHIESIKVAEPANMQDKRIVNVVGASGISGFKVGDFLEWNRGKEKNRLLLWDVHHKQAVVDGKVVAITLRDERYEELVLEVDDFRSEKVMRVLQAMLNEASS